jgi:hypothetical protein
MDGTRKEEALRFLLRNGKFTKDDILNYLKEYALHPDYERPYLEIVAKNAVDVTHDYFLTLSKNKKKLLLRNLEILVDVALSLKLWQNWLSRTDAAWYFEGTPFYYSALSSLTSPLEEMRANSRAIDSRRGSAQLLLVEGEAEFCFIKTIQANLPGRMAFDFDVYNYQGKGNVQALWRYIKEKNRQGIRTRIVYDKDGTTRSFLGKLKSKQCKIDGSFGFSRDFESAFGSDYLKVAIAVYSKQYIGKQLTLKSSDIDQLRAKRRPVIAEIENLCGINVSKAKLGAILGSLIIPAINEHWNDVFNRHRRAYSDEIFAFMRFMVK